MGDSASVSSLVLSFSPCFGVFKIFFIFQTLSIVRTWEYLYIGNMIAGRQFSTKLNNSRRERERRIQPTPCLRLHCDLSFQVKNNYYRPQSFTYTEERNVHNSDFWPSRCSLDKWHFLHKSFVPTKVEILIEIRRETFKSDFWWPNCLFLSKLIITKISCAKKAEILECNL